MKAKQNKKGMNKLVLLLLALALVIAFAIYHSNASTRTAGSSKNKDDELIEEQFASLTPIRLGASEFIVDLPAGYTRQPLSQEAISQGQVGTYTCENNDMVVDVYNLPLIDRPSTLTTFAEKEASVHNADLKFDVVDGTMVAYFASEQEFDGTACQTMTYLLSADSGYVVLVLHQPSGNLVELGRRIFRSLRACDSFQLGESPYSIMISDDFIRDELTFDEAFEGHYGHYRSASSLVDIDLSQYRKADQPDTLATFAAQEAAKRDMQATTENINGIVVMTYACQEQYDGQVYNGRSYMFETDDSYIKLTFLMDGEGAAEEVSNIINTLAKRLQLGSSRYYLSVSGDYEAGKINQEDQVGAFSCKRTKLAFDVYEVSKEGKPASLQGYASQQASSYKAKAAVGELNNNEVAYYRVTQKDKETLSFVLDNAEQNTYLKVVFRLASFDQVDAALEIMQTLQSKPTVQLSGTPYTLTVPNDLIVGIVKHADSGQVGSYFGSESPVEFDVYEIAKTSEKLDTFATKRAKKHGGTAVLGTMGGANVAYYTSTRDCNGQDRNALTLLIDAGNAYEEVIFWLDDTPALELLDTIRSLKSRDEASAKTSAMLLRAESVQAQEQTDTVRIGVFEPTSGTYATGGKWETLGIDYAHQETPTVEIDGKTYKVELVKVDDGSSEESAAAAAEQLVKENVSVVLGSFNNVTSLAGSPYFADANIPAIGMSCTGPSITDGKAHYFRICYTDFSAGTLLASYAANELDAKTVYTLSEAGNEHDRSISHSFGQYFKYRGGTVLEGSFESGEKDFRPFLKEAIGEGVDVMFCPLTTKAGVELVKQAAELNVPFPILGTNQWDNKDKVAKAAKGTDLKVVISSLYTEGVSEPFDKGFKKWLKSDSSRLAANGGTNAIFSPTGMGYDGYYTALEALKAAGSTNPLYVMNALSRVSFTGITGSISFTSEGNADRGTVFMKTVNTDTGKWEYQMEYRVKK